MLNNQINGDVRKCTVTLMELKPHTGQSKTWMCVVEGIDASRENNAAFGSWAAQES